MRSTLKKVASVLALAAVMTACGADDGAAQDGAEEWSTDFTRHTIPLDEIVSGGPPKDGIPAIDRPRYVPVAEARAWLRDEEPVLVVEGGSVVRAYPYQVLIWHEIVNDDVAALPLAVTYCPLCNTALVFRREHGGRILDFGTTGRVRHSDLVMYDRQTESWWQQATGEAIVGELAGERLEAYPARTASWREFRESHPQGEVLSRETGFDRPYGRNPYVGYDRRSGPIAQFFRLRVDERLRPMERVVAIAHGGADVAYPFARLSSERAAMYAKWWNCSMANTRTSSTSYARVAAESSATATPLRCRITALAKALQQRHEPHWKDASRSHLVVRHLFDEDQVLHTVEAPHRDDHAATELELLDEGRRNGAARRRYDDGVVRGMPTPSVVPVGVTGGHVVETEAFEALGRRHRELLEDLHGVDLAPHLVENGGLVA